MFRLLILAFAAVAAAAAAGHLLPGAAPFLADTPPAVVGALAALATLVVADLSMRVLTDGRTASQLRRLAAKSEALELELATLRAGGLAAAAAQLTAAVTPTPPPAAPGETPPPAVAPRIVIPPAGTAPRRGEPAGDASLRESVREALRADRIALHVQPIVDLSDRRPRFHVCTPYLRTAGGALLSPQLYQPIVEEDGLTVAIDNMLLLRCVQLVRNAQRRDRPATYFCALSGQSLADRVFFSDFLDFASDNALVSEHLVFEIDHRTLAGLPPEAKQDLRRLADLGYRFAITNADLDAIDAGLLTDHRIAFVEARVADIAERATRDRHLIDLERPLLLAGAELIATRIERDSHLAALAALPVSLGQGPLIGEPAPIESLRAD